MIPRAANITISTQLPAPLREKLVEATFVEWPEVPLNESPARTKAIEAAIKWGKEFYPGLFRPEY